MRVVPWLLVCVALSPPAGAGEAKPTKEAAVKVLKDFHAALKAKDIDRALTYLFIPDKLKDHIDELKKSLRALEGTREITAKGIEVLATKGKWGNLKELQDEAEAKRMTFGSADLGKCYGLFVGSRSGAAFVWDGKAFRLSYFNNIGSLEDDRGPD
jgi:hypothetical protein